MDGQVCIGGFRILLCLDISRERPNRKNSVFLVFHPLFFPSTMYLRLEICCDDAKLRRVELVSQETNTKSEEAKILSQR